MKIHWTDAKAKTAIIYLDGLRCFGVLEADDSEGYIERYKKDAADDYIIDGNKVVTERVYGVVKIEFEPVEVLGDVLPTP